MTGTAGVWTEMRIPQQTRGWYLGVLLLIAAALAVQSFTATTPSEGSDFHVFWSSGRHLLDGTPLYEPAAGARPFVYPPTAALLFAPFALADVSTAAAIFTVLDAFFALVCLAFVLSLVKPASKTRNEQLLILAGIVLSARFIFNNHALLQINQLLFLVTLAGIRLVLGGRDRSAGALFAAAALVKLVPGLFLVWLAVRKGVRSLGGATAVVGFAVAALVIVRGPETMLADVREYYAAFLEPFTQGAVSTSYTNQSLPAAVGRAISALGASDPLGRWLIGGATLFVLLGCLTVLRRRAARGEDVEPAEFALVFLTGHLVAGITWKAHLVTMSFVLPVAALTVRRLPLPMRAILYGLAVLVGLTGRDLVGRGVHEALGAASVITLLLALLWAMAVAGLTRRRVKPPRNASVPRPANLPVRI